ncbi:MAG: ATP-binding protein [Candidatus Eisenbacteria bacterium]|nr:ATP-binding protein [Candidatus Eisenbacteria bacterium]
MTDSLPTPLKQALTAKLAESLVGTLPAGTPRQVHGAVEMPGKATAVIGMRRAGKTTFLHQLRRERLERGVPRECLPYLNFEDERLTGLEAGHLSFLVEEYGRRFSETRSHDIVTWCFDEIQVVPGWERFVRRLLDEGRYEILVTGSSAALLSREIATALRGRAWEVRIFPFSFAEALRHRQLTIPGDLGMLTGAERARIESAFSDWLTGGGFPEAQGLKDASRHQLLRDYVDVAIFRDVVERHGVTNVLGLRWLVRHLLGNAASLFSVEKFYGALRSQGVAISKDTVHHLLAHLEDCFLVRTVWMESTSERQRMVNPRKSYPVDSGLIPLFDRTGRGNTGHALETAVLIELERRRLEVTYVRTPAGHEVDFLARGHDGRSDLIQVCADASDPATAERELRALVEAGQLYPESRRLLLTMSADGAPPGSPTEVIVRPAYEWMLDE